MKYKTSKYCRNCHYPLPYKAKFCAHCGQKDTDGRVSVFSLLKQVWNRMFHLEGRFFMGVGRLFIPGQVSLDYFNGKQKRYPPPLQFFFVVMFFFLLLLNQFDNGQGMRLNNEQASFSFNNSPKEDKVDFYEAAKRYALTKEIQQLYDSLSPEYRSPSTRRTLDTLMSSINKEGRIFFDEAHSEGVDAKKANMDSMEIGLFTVTYKIATADLAGMDADKVIKKYKVQHKLHQVAVKQSIKAIKSPQELLRVYIGSFAWTILLLIALMSGLLSLLYWRQRRVYVEHFIFLLHNHTAIFLLLTFVLALSMVTPFGLALIIAFAVWITINTWMALRRFYRQNWWLTSFKWGVFGLIYLFALVVLFVFSLFLALVIF